MRTTTPAHRWMPRLSIFLGLAALFSALAARVDAAPEASAERAYAASMSPKEHATRLRLLRRTAQDFHFHRKAFPKQCHHCNGTGRVGGRTRRRGKDSVGLGTTFSDCPTCTGNGLFVSPKSFMKVYHTLRSPAFRAAEGRRREIEALHGKAQRGELELARMRRYRYQRGELVDAEHAIAWYLYDKSKTPAATQWVWRADKGKKPTWFAYTADSDDAWPRPARTLTSIVEAAERANDWKSITRSARSRLAEALADAGYDLDAFVARTNGSDLLLRQTSVPVEAMDRAQLGRRVHAAAAMAGAVHARGLGYDRVRIELRLPMRHRTGRVHMKLGLRAELSRAVFAAADWQALDARTRVGRLALAPIEQAGYEVVLAEDA